MYASDHREVKAITGVWPSRSAVVEQENRMYRKCMIAAYVVLALLFVFFALRQG